MRRNLIAAGSLFAASLLLVLLWLPAIRYPIVSDTAIYALVGKSVWSGDGYRLFGELYTKHLPLQAVVSYPFVAAFGSQVGMKLSSLLAGSGVLLMTYLLMRRVFSWRIAMLTTFFVLLHPGFILMTMLGSADLLFAALFLGSILCYLKAESNRQFYWLMGLLTGLACLARHNGLALLLLFPLSTFLWRRRDLKSMPFWIGMMIGAALPFAWMIRAYLISGSLFGIYVNELQTESDGRIAQLFSNVVYYANPIHNVFPFLFPFAVYGVVRYGRRYPFLVLSMLAAWLLTSIWWVQAIRFAFPGYPILLGFAALGVRDLWMATGRWRPLIVTAMVGGFAAIQGLSFCLYTYGACNAAFDRMIGGVPANMRLSSEGFHTWSIARDWLNANVQSGGTVIVDDFLNEAVWQKGVFRDDLRVLAEGGACPRYRITQFPAAEERVLFTTEGVPLTSVVLQSCP
jgi:4-amino-4-deoxy-L-arabinose transferase-like glycosyltransferase